MSSTPLSKEKGGATSKTMKRIFVVDDEADINLTINTALEENGFEVNAYDYPVIALDNFRKGALA
jgi:DNA-binding response OmpR family regulator